MTIQTTSERPLTEVRRQPLRHTVRTRIEQAIVEGTFQGGEKLNEAELSGALGVSRGLLREALRELEASGVLVSVPYRGTFVKEWTPQSVWELYTLRSTLEEFAVALVVERATDEELDELDGLMQAMRQAAQNEDIEELVDLDMRFHERMQQIAGHRLLRHMLKSLGGQMRIFIIATKAYYSPFASLDEAALSHEPILEALRARDVEAAQAAVSEHIREVGERYVEQLEANGGPAE
jgi:DNA-binding GntR family transcriptional regulator